MDIKDDNKLVRIVNSKEEDDGSLTLTIEASTEVMDAFRRYYGTDDFGDMLVQDCIAYAEKHAEELKEMQNDVK